jgi:hypothetical protein
VQMIVVMFLLNYAIFAGDLRFWIISAVSFPGTISVYEEQINDTGL